MKHQTFHVFNTGRAASVYVENELFTKTFVKDLMR